MKMKLVRSDEWMDSISGSDRKSRGDSASSTGTRRRGSRENQELYAELKAKADKLEKEFEAHKCRISHDRSGSGPWSKVPVEANEMKKGGDHGGSNSLRGELYDKYMEKRDARLRTERGSKLAVMNEAKLRAMRDDLERWRGEMQGKVVLPEQANISGAQRRLQKFRSFNTRSSPTSEEGEVDARWLEEDGDLMKFLRQNSTRREQSESKESKRDVALPISRSYEPRKDFPVRNPSSSSVARAVAPPIPRPLNKSTGYSSWRQRAKPENPLDFRKENTKPPPIISRKANQSIARNIVQTRMKSEVPEKLQFAKKNSVSPLDYKNSSKRNVVCQKMKYSMSFESEPLQRKAMPRALVDKPRNGKSHCNLLSDMDELADIAKVDVMSMMFDEEESDQDLLEKFSKSIDLDPFLGNAFKQSPGNVASFNMENKQDRGNLTVATNDEGNTGKISCFVLRNDEDDLGDSAIEANDSQDLRSSRESGNFESINGDSMGSQSFIDRLVDSASELPNSSDLKNSEPVSVENPNGISTVSAIEGVISYEADADQIQRDVEIPLNPVPLATYSHGRSRKGIINGDSVGSQSCINRSVDSASELPNSSDLKNSEPVSIENPNGISTASAIVGVISYEAEADADQIQRDVEIPPNPVPLATYSRGRSRKGIKNGFRRFLILSKKSRGDECSADWLSTTTSEGDDEIFSESIVLEEQVRSLHLPVPPPSERIKHKVGYASEKSLKATRSFFSLSSFRCKGDDSKPR